MSMSLIQHSYLCHFLGYAKITEFSCTQQTFASVHLWQQEKLRTHTNRNKALPLTAAHSLK